VNATRGERAADQWQVRFDETERAQDRDIVDYLLNQLDLL
jgi:hypothetical protein